jgi:hypothetical protein
VPSIFGAAQVLLDQFTTRLSAITLADGTPFPFPDLAYIGSGEIPWDDESFTVYLDTSDQGQPGAPRSTSVVDVHALTFYATFYAQLLRPQPAPLDSLGAAAALPSMDDLNDAGLVAMRDADALQNSAVALKAAAAVGDAPLWISGTGFVVGPVGPVGPTGGLAAMRIRLDVSL